MGRFGWAATAAALASLALLAASGCNRDAVPVPEDMAAPQGRELGFVDDPPADLAGSGTSDLGCLESSDLTEIPESPFAIEHADWPLPIIPWVLADLDGDRILDAIEIPAAFRRGLGGGAFAPAVLIDAQRYPAVQAADLDDDGVLDLMAFACQGGVSYLNNGKGTFGKPVSFSLPECANGLIPADLDRDNKSDLLAIYRDGYSIHHGRGDGSFVGAVKVPFNLPKPSPSAVGAAVDDWNGDGRLDFIVETSGGKQGVAAFLILQGGLGTFTPPVALPVAGSATSAVPADFDRDGHLDVAIGTLEGPQVVLLGKGDGTFSSIVLGAGSMPTPVAAADFNADRIPDLVVGGYGTGVLVGRGDGTFEDAPLCAAGGTNFLFAGPPPMVVDFDGDGRLDVVTDSSWGAMVMRGRGDGTLRCGLEAGLAGGQLAGGDLDGDGIADLVISTQDGKVLVSPGRKRHLARTATEQMKVERNAPVRLADIDGDGDLDLLFGLRGSGAPGNPNHDAGVLVALGRGDGTFQTAVLSSTPHIVRDFTIADIDADGHADVITVNWEGAVMGETGTTVMHGKGDGTFVLATDLPRNNETCGVAASDLDGDGRVDLAVAHYDSAGRSEGGILLYAGDGTGRFDNPAELLAQPAAVRSVLSADLDGNGHADLIAAADPFVWSGGRISRLFVWMQACGGQLELSQAIDLPGSRNAVGPLLLADLTGDGARDLLIVRGGSFGSGIESLWCTDCGVFYGSTLLRNTGHGRFGTVLDLPTGISSAVGDFDGDGKPDVASSHNVLYLHYGGL